MAGSWNETPAKVALVVEVDLMTAATALAQALEGAQVLSDYKVAGRPLPDAKLSVLMRIAGECATTVDAVKRRLGE